MDSIIKKNPLLNNGVQKFKLGVNSFSFLQLFAHYGCNITRSREKSEKYHITLDVPLRFCYSI